LFEKKLSSYNNSLSYNSIYHHRTRFITKKSHHDTTPFITRKNRKQARAVGAGPRCAPRLASPAQGGEEEARWRRRKKDRVDWIGVGEKKIKRERKEASG
jgi:hypothetical protein